MSEQPASLRSLLSGFSQAHQGAGYFHSLRYVHQDSVSLSVSRNVIDPPRRQSSRGVMLCVRVNGNEAFAATSDLTVRGLALAYDQALMLARAIGSHALLHQPAQQGAAFEASYRSPGAGAPLPATGDWLELLRSESARVPRHDKLVNWSAGLRIVDRQQLYYDSTGSEIASHKQLLLPRLDVTAFDGRQSQRRTWGISRQGGTELVQGSGFIGQIEQVADQALQLLAAPNTPEGPRDLLLLPDQMILQIHESIGHPLELDRILGDERNFAGTSFVTQDMFGSYQYGSPLLNVSFDPHVTDELGSYSHDDEGLPAQKHLLIEAGVLKRPLGAALSQARSGMEGVANSRACDWNRPPIDRMANLNIEPGDQSLAQMIGTIEHGILMATNRSWSIDQARNKFQFGCEWGQLIENGRLAGVVKNPNYRGISSQFWRKLSAVGDRSTLQVLGTPNCGKGEPNQSITVGHASPACVFDQIDVFGGQA
ncbi:tldD-like metalloprotease [Pseudomonas reidholzensis]|uniref:TldD-like metalloprotease n=1 Tax=Pseudomonas reidholzensis TaxID=1785162 RepID=A0A383RYJ0_9PSED|nr:TldD/PmbA family protein [Pseudomonas reidholzensis]SYX91833.1 tldD-like metalloprotease [Pseudomonas reidholzensis]